MPPGDLPDDLQRPLDESIPPTVEPTVDSSTVDSSTVDPTVERSTTDPPPETTDLRPAVPDLADSPETPAGAVLGHAAPSRLTRIARIPAHAVARTVARAARAVRTWWRRPVGRLVVPSLLILALLGAAGAGGGVVFPGVYEAAEPEPGVTRAGEGPLPTTPPSRPPAPPGGGPTGPPTGPGNRADALRGWADQMSDRTGVPALALQAYGYAELVLARTTPGCQLRWTTLAAIGRVESNHGSSGGATLLPDGRALPAIMGDPLDGTGDRLLITDTDGGELDGDVQYDRAVGPMQFIPRTWRTEAVDATGDGLADVHNIHDAALAAANYLCRNQRDLSVIEDWWEAILAYNNVTSYANAVFDAANEYGQLSH